MPQDTDIFSGVFLQLAEKSATDTYVFNDYNATVSPLGSAATSFTISFEVNIVQRVLRESWKDIEDAATKNKWFFLNIPNEAGESATADLTFQPQVTRGTSIQENSTTQTLASLNFGLVFPNSKANGSNGV